VTEPIQSDILTPLRCRKCGSNRITVPAHSTDESRVTCTDCGDDIGGGATTRSTEWKGGNRQSWGPVARLDRTGHFNAADERGRVLALSMSCSMLSMPCEWLASARFSFAGKAPGSVSGRGLSTLLF